MIYQFDDFQVDATSFRLSREQAPLDLEPKALQLLIFLLQNKGRLLKKQELLEAIWGDLSVTENALTREIALLRRVLGDSTKEPKYIETVPTQGYRFIAAVVELREEDPPSPQSDISSPNPMEVRRPRWLQHKLRMALAAVVALLCFTCIMYFLSARRSSHAPAENGANRLHLIQLTFSNGLDVFPNFSPDGKSIAYSSDKSGAFEIYLRQLESSGGEIQLTHDGAGNIQAAWSPDGQWIAYHSTKNGGIWIIPSLGGTPRRITNFGSHPDWSHDGSRIAFESGNAIAMIETESGGSLESTLWIVNPSDGSLRQITHPTKTSRQFFGDDSPRWAPNDQRILFSRSGQMWTVGVEKEDLQEVAPGQFAYNSVYGNDGKTIYFLSSNEEGSGIWEIPLNQDGSVAGAAQKIHSTTPGATHHLTVAGKRLIFSVMSTRDNLYSIAAFPTGSETVPMPVTQDTRMRKTYPSISPDGSLIAFAVHQIGRRSQIWIVPADGKDARQIPIEGDAFNPSWKDGNTLCYWTYDNHQIDLWNWNLKAGMPVKVFSTDEKMNMIRPSPDGKTAAYQRTDDGIMNVWTHSMAENQSRQLTFQKSMAGWPSWSHDGKMLAIEVKDGPDTQIAIVPAAGGTPVFITHDHGQHWPFSWSPDDKEIAFAGFRDGVWNIFTVSPKSEIQRQLTHYDQANTFVRYPEWSPNGQQIVYEYGVSAANIWMLEPR